jgi:adenine deaminase
MHQRGVLVSFNSDSSDHARRLNFEAAKAVKYGGTSEADALRFVTLNPARQLRIDHRVGSLAPGRDADFAIWSGHPLDSSSLCLETWIDGARYFDRSLESARTTALRDEHTRLVAKARKSSKAPDKPSSPGSAKSDAARALFFQRALEHAQSLGVVDCKDCQLQTLSRP